jgi:threonylcarbamoyladenosine tRNA methylthiotransferase CDKAL1
VKSFGCPTSLADGAVLAGCLRESGCALVDSVASADVVIYNTCAVKGPTEDRMVGLLKRVPRDKKLVVAGCLPIINSERLVSEVRFDGVVGPAAGRKIVGVLDRVYKGERVVALENSVFSKPELLLPRVALSGVASVVPISYGCLGSCAYCCVVAARGRLRSCSIEDVVERVERDVAAGMREFWLTSQDTACYGRDVGVDLARLLEALCGVEGDFRLRVGMMTPNCALDILEDLVKAFRDERVFKFVHLPVQSGDDDVLRRMRRLYSVDDFRTVVGAFRERFPGLTLATDVICGFPGESDGAFEGTLRLIEEVEPDVVNVSKFFPRPGTLAAGMREKFVPSREVRRRSRVLGGLVRRVVFGRNRRWLGWSGEVLFDETGKVLGSWVGRNFAYRPVVVKSDLRLLGEKRRVRVVAAFPTYLEGVVVE